MNGDRGKPAGDAGKGALGDATGTESQSQEEETSASGKKKETPTGKDVNVDNSGNDSDDSDRSDSQSTPAKRMGRNQRSHTTSPASSQASSISNLTQESPTTAKAPDEAPSIPDSLTFPPEDVKRFRTVLDVALKSVVAEATKCNIVHRRAMEGFDDMDDNDPSIPLWILKLWFPNAEKWWTGKEAMGKVPEINEVAAAFVAAMEGKEVWYPTVKREATGGNTPPRLKQEIHKPDEKSADPITSNFHRLSSQFSFLPFALFLHLGWDEKALTEHKTFKLWLNAQPRVNRPTSVDRMITSRVPEYGVVDRLVGRDGEASTAALEDLDKEEVHGCLYALGKVMSGPGPLQRPGPESSSIETMVRAVVGSNDHNGIVQSDTPPRGCTCEDLEGTFKMLTNKTFGYCFRKSIKEKSQEEKTLLCFEALQEAFAGFDLAKIEGWIKLYHILHIESGFPKLTKENASIHKFLVPTSWNEMFLRVVLMFLASTNVRMTIQNGALRVASFRHAIAGILPSCKPVEGVTSGVSRTDFDSCFDKILNSNHLNSVLLPQLMKSVPATVCLPKRDPQWSEDVRKTLFVHSEQVQKGADHMARREGVDLAAVVLGGLIERAEEISHVAARTSAGESWDAKPGTLHFKQVIWSATELMLTETTWFLVEGISQEIRTYVEVCLIKPISDIDSKKKPNSKNGPNKICKKMRDNWSSDFSKQAKQVTDFSDKHHGCSTMNSLMLSEGGCGDSIAMTVDSIMSKVTNICFVLFNLCNPKRGFNKLIGKTGLCPGNPALPDAVCLIVGLTGYLIWDKTTAEKAHKLVKNNGQGSQSVKPSLRGQVVERPVDPVLASRLSRVRIMLVCVAAEQECLPNASPPSLFSSVGSPTIGQMHWRFCAHASSVLPPEMC